MRKLLATTLLAGAALAGTVSPAQADAVPADATTCWNAAGTKVCTTTTTATVLGDPVSATSRVEVGDTFEELEGVSRTETVTQTTTVTRTRKGVTSSETSTEVVSSTVQPLSCIVTTGFIGSQPSVGLRDVSECASRGLFRAPTVPTTPSEPGSACAAALVGAKGVKTCTSTSLRLGPVSAANGEDTAVPQPVGSLRYDLYTGTSRLVETVETTLTSRKGVLSSTERVMSSARQPLSCYQLVVYKRAYDVPGLVDHTRCAELGLFTAGAA